MMPTAAAEKQAPVESSDTTTAGNTNGTSSSRYGGVMHARHPVLEAVAFVVPRVDVRWVLERAKDGTLGDRPLGPKNITTRSEYALCPSCLPAEDPSRVAECPNRGPVPPAPFDDTPHDADGPSAEVTAEARGSRCPYMHVDPARLQRYEAHLRTRADRYARMAGASEDDGAADVTVAVGRAMVTTGGAFVDWIPLSAILKTRAINVVVDSPEQARAQAIEDARIVTEYLEKGAPDGPALKEGRSIGMHCAHWATHGVCAYGETCYFVHAMTYSETTAQHFRDRYNKKDRRKAPALPSVPSGDGGAVASVAVADPPASNLPAPIPPAGDDGTDDGEMPAASRGSEYDGPEYDGVPPEKRKKLRKKLAKAAAVAAALALVNQGTNEQAHGALQSQHQQPLPQEVDTSGVVPLGPPPQYQPPQQPHSLPGPPLSTSHNHQHSWQPQPPPAAVPPAPRSAAVPMYQQPPHQGQPGYPSEETLRYEQQLLMQHEQQQHVRRAFAQQFQQSLAAQQQQHVYGAGQNYPAGGGYGHYQYGGHQPHRRHHHQQVPPPPPPPPFGGQQNQYSPHHPHSPSQPPQHHRYGGAQQQGSQAYTQIDDEITPHGFAAVPSRAPPPPGHEAPAASRSPPSTAAAPLMPPQPVDAPPMPPMAI